MDELIRVDNLCKSFGTVPALRGVSFNVSSSELTVIIGPSGCGKSTLLRCLNGLELFDSGYVQMGDITLDRHNEAPPRDLNAKLRRLREEVGIVFQGFNLFPHLTVLENVVKAPMIVKGLSREVAAQQCRS